LKDVVAISIEYLKDPNTFLINSSLACSGAYTLRAHKSLVKHVLELHRQRPDLRLGQGFAMAKTLRINFYETTFRKKRLG